MQKIKPEVKDAILKAMKKSEEKVLELEPDKMSLLIAVVQATTFITLIGYGKNFYRWRADMGFTGKLIPDKNADKS